MAAAISRTMAWTPAEPTPMGLRQCKETTMKSWFMGLMLAVVALALIPATSDARRLGGGKSTGMQRATPDKAAQSTPATPATPAATPNTPGAPTAAAAPTAGAAAAAAAPKRSWMGPIAGLAAGLGLAALFSHLGMGEQFANFIMLALLAVVAVVVIRLLVRRFAGGGAKGMPFAMAGAAGSAGGIGAQARREPVAPAWSGASAAPSSSALPAPVAAPALTAPAAPSLPADFDTEAFERLAKMIFIRMQAANDSADLNDLRAFTTPELFASLRLDLQDRGAAAQQTDVMKVDARIVDFAQEDDRQIVSVHYQGLVREDPAAGAVPFDEVWHLVKPLGDSRAWAIAGIQQH
jgi:predicted lipid-binding transport protein (Tim44 family)